jgi:hypothetical protein
MGHTQAQCGNCKLCIGHATRDDNYVIIGHAYVCEIDGQGVTDVSPACGQYDPVDD